MKYILSFMLIFVISNFDSLKASENIYIDNIKIAEEYSEENNTDLLIVFSADWCRYCVDLKDAINNDIVNISKAYTICIVDYDTNRDLVQKYKISKLPESVILKDSILIKKKIGFNSYENYRMWLGL